MIYGHAVHLGMANAVFIQNPKSIYKDRPGIAYHFPKRYLRTVQECIGDWVVFYEGKTGALGYCAVQRVRSVTPDPDQVDHYFAWLDLETRWDFERVVPRNDAMGVAFERSLRGPNGKAISGGASVSAVRRLTFDEFSSIVSAGLKPVSGPDAMPRSEYGTSTLMSGFGEEQEPFDSPDRQDIRESVLSSRMARDQSFARSVKSAYKGRCAISGLDLRNGGGRAEVQAAHIRPMKDKGPDTVINGLALSGTLHWMFDRGLVGLADDLTILVSRQSNDIEAVTSMINSSGKILVPDRLANRPRAEFVNWHRENCFKH